MDELLGRARKIRMNHHYSGPVDERHLVRRDDVLFAWSGQIVSLGAHVWDSEEAILNQHIFKVVPRSTYLPRFVKEGLDYLVDEMASQVRGLEMFHIRKQEVEKLLFPTLPIDQQRQVVAHLDALRDHASFMTKAQRERSEALDALLPSILDKALRGDL